MIRRSFLRKLAAVPFFAAAAAVLAATNPAKLKILMKSAWGSDDPTKAAFHFLHGDALSEAGHEIQIFLLGDLSFFRVLEKSRELGKLLKLIKVAGGRTDFVAISNRAASRDFFELLPCQNIFDPIHRD